MSTRNNPGDKPPEDSLGFNNAPPGDGTPGDKPPEQNNDGDKKDAPDADRKIGLERYLQKFPKENGITALLRLKHKADVKTIQGWEAVIKELLHKKVQ